MARDLFAWKRPDPTKHETAPTPAENVNARVAHWTASRRARVVLGCLAFVMVALSGAASTARPVRVEQRSFGLGLRSAGAAHAAGCVPVPAAQCGSVRVPLFWSNPAGPKIDVAYALIHHTDAALPKPRGTVVLNVGGSNMPIIDNAPMWAAFLSNLLRDHDLLLIDSRGDGRSHPISCGVTALPGTREGYVRAIGRCGKRLGRQARAYTYAATADDMNAVRKHLGIPKLELYGVSTGTYLMTVFAQRHPNAVRSIVLSSAFPLGFDMWGRKNAQALRLAIMRVCARSTTGKCNGEQTLRQLAQLAQRLHAHPIPYTLNGQPRLLDDTTLAGIAYWAAAGFVIGQLPAVVRAALAGDNQPLITAAQTLGPLFSGSGSGGAAPDLAQPTASGAAPHLVQPTPSDLALSAAVMCNSYPTLWDRHAPIPVRLRQFAARRARLSPATFWPFSARAWTSAIIDRGNACIRWPDRNPPVQRTTGPFPNVPVLVISGDLDTNTPTAEGRQAARQFPNARVVEIPNAGHGAEQEPTGCALSITTYFIRYQHLGNTSCLAKIPPLPVN